VLYSEFKNQKALEIYQKHPQHVKVTSFVRKIKEERGVMDYII